MVEIDFELWYDRTELRSFEVCLRLYFKHTMHAHEKMYEVVSHIYQILRFVTIFIRTNLKFTFLISSIIIHLKGIIMGYKPDLRA